MSNKSVHLAGAGIVVNAKEGYSLYKDVKHGQSIDLVTILKRLAIANTAGAVGVMLPDILEPATDPNHRKFFHSIAIGTLLIIFFVLLYKKIISIENEDVKRVLSYLGIGYGVHLAQDGCTPMGLPLVYK